MGAYAEIDIDLQDLVATIETMRGEGLNLEDAESEAGLEARAILHSRLVDLGWLTPTERSASRRAFDRGDGQSLLALLGGASVGN